VPQKAPDSESILDHAFFWGGMPPDPLEGSGFALWSVPAGEPTYTHQPHF